MALPSLNLLPMPLVLLVLLLAGPGSLTQVGGQQQEHPAPVAPGSSPVPVIPNRPCPARPLDACDFYVRGFRDDMPLLEIPRQGPADVAISPALQDSHWPEGEDRGFVRVDATFRDKFYCPAPDGTANDGIHPELSDVFYIASAQQGLRSRIRAGNLTPTVSKRLHGRCVVIPIRSVTVNAPQGKRPITLRPGDGRKQYPERKRCVVFQTGPRHPVCHAKAPPHGPPSSPPKSPASPRSPKSPPTTPTSPQSPRSPRSPRVPPTLPQSPPSR